MSLFKTTAQDSLSFNKKYVAKNNISAEIGGTAIFYSLNYERNFGIKEKSFHTIRAGLSYMNLAFSSNGMGFYLPIGYSYNIGRKKNKFFVGTGATLIIATNPYPTTFAGRKYARSYADTSKTIWGQQFTDYYIPLFDIAFQPIFIGYQYVSKKRFYFKATATTLLVNESPIKQHYQFFGWGGFTFGLKLGKIKKYL